MLLSTDTSGRRGSIFVCDRCKKKIYGHRDIRYRITGYEAKTGYYKQDNKWDLCDRCYRALCRGIKKGVQKKDGMDIQCEHANDQKNGE